MECGPGMKHPLVFVAILALFHGSLVSQWNEELVALDSSGLQDPSPKPSPVVCESNNILEPGV